VPPALGLTTEEWVQNRLGGYVELPVAERREKVAPLTAPAEEGGKGLSIRQAAVIVGVSVGTVVSDKRGVQNRTLADGAQAESVSGAVQNRTVPTEKYSELRGIPPADAAKVATRRRSRSRRSRPL